ncbi:MAG: hypothetical protein EOP01_03940, partial [Propionibacteriaceae bacterium]
MVDIVIDRRQPATGVSLAPVVRGLACRLPRCQLLRHTEAPCFPPYQPIRYAVARHRPAEVETKSCTRWPLATLLWSAYPSTGAADRVPGDLPNVGLWSEEMRQAVVGFSTTTAGTAGSAGEGGVTGVG